MAYAIRSINFQLQRVINDSYPGLNLITTVAREIEKITIQLYITNSVIGGESNMKPLQLRRIKL